MNINELTDEQKLHTLHALLLWYSQADVERNGDSDFNNDVAYVASEVLRDALAGGVR